MNTLAYIRHVFEIQGTYEALLEVRVSHYIVKNQCHSLVNDVGRQLSMKQDVTMIASVLCHKLMGFIYLFIFSTRGCVVLELNPGQNQDAPYIHTRA